MTLKLVVLAIGNELLHGRVDTNGPALERALQPLGFEPQQRLILPDRLPVLVEALRTQSRRATLVLCCGGLGPTQDDLTRQAVARAFDRPLVFVASHWQWIQARFQQLQRPLPENDRVQAMVPRGSQLLPNRNGTAAGFLLKLGPRRWVAALPGPPNECSGMLNAALIPRLKPQLPRPGDQILRSCLRTAGMGESALQERLGRLFPEPARVELGFLLDEPGEVFVGLTGRGQTVVQARQRLRAGVARVARVLGKDLVDRGPRPLAEVVGRLLQKRRETLAVAESCTGGQVSSKLTAIPGSSRYFLEGAVTYANSAKVQRLGVPASLLRQTGAVSPVVALAMAQGIRRTSCSDWGLGITGIAGPGGGTAAKPVGLVYLAVAGPHGVYQVRELHGVGNRELVQRRSASAALDLLRRALLSAPTPTRRKGHVGKGK